MKITKYLIIFFVILTSLMFIFTGVYADEGVGFKAKLAWPATFVSPYYKVEGQYISSIVPEKFPFLSYRLELSPTVSASSFSDKSLRFETRYYQYKSIKKYMIPLSVDAESYLAYNLQQSYSQSLNQSTKNSILKEKAKSRSGLGINVALPKRLDKIFGEGGAGLKVSGMRRITFAGRSSWTDAAQTPGYRQNKFPSLRMEQISRFDITGTIGSKITVKVSQDSQTDIPLANRVQIRYKGDEDDILKSIEAGNTTLSLPNTKFVGYSSQIRGLFGLKAQAQVGNLSLTAIASQEKGSTEKTSISATGQENATIIRDHQYEERRIFDLGLPDEYAPDDKFIKLYVYESIRDYNNDFTGTEADFYVDPDITDPNRKSYPEDQQSKGLIWVEKIPNDEYWWFDEPENNSHYIVFKSRRNNDYYLGYWAQIAKGNGDTITVGNLGDSVYTLKMLATKSSKANPQQVTWNQMWRNCYRVNTSESATDINFKIYRGLDETNSDNRDYQESQGKTFKYLEILGLDQYNSLNRNISDELLDNRQEVYRPEWGLVIFPSRRPFDSDTTFVFENGVETDSLAVKDRIPSIYDYKSPTEKISQSNFYIQYSTKSRSDVIKLNRANIIEGSERVYAGGRLLAKGTDYNIQYDFGQVTLISPEATDPNADITIEFEYAPFFAVQKKSLFGMRGEYELSRDFSFGSTFLYKSDKAQDRKPKVGQETARTIIYDADMSLKLHPNFLTDVIDAIPFIEAETPSNLSISGEVAQSHPNPNIDNVAYVDDFESAHENLSLGTSRSNWYLASLPEQIRGYGYERGKILWHNPRELIAVDQVYTRDTRAGEGNMRTFRMVFKPKTQTVDDDGIVTNVKSWAGIMRPFINRVDSKRAQLFEVRARTNNGIKGKLHFDFGIIDEDVDGDGILDREDKNQSNSVEFDEDVGLDGVPDEEEPGYDPITNPDPNGDNWYFLGEGDCPLPNNGCDNIDWESEAWYYEFLNGTEGNITDPAASTKGDREGYESNESNSYFSYIVDFSKTPLGEDYRVDESKQNDWYTYRIPIRDSLRSVDSTYSEGLLPDWASITHVRVWFESEDEFQTDADTIEVADWGFVQSYWQDELIFGEGSDYNSRFVVATISDEIDESFPDNPPEEIKPYKDPSTGVVEPMRALMMEFENLKYTDTCLAVKDLISVERYSGYRNLEMFVHYDGYYNKQLNDPIPQDTSGKVRFFFRIGKDANNYYETYTDIYPGWDERNFIKFDFYAMTAFKDSVIRIYGDKADMNASNDKYRIVGKPSINEIRFFTAGVANTNTEDEVNGTVWLDELRVTEVRRDVGTAARFTLSGNLSDLITYNFNFESKDPYFRGLSSATRGGSSDNLGSGKTDTRYNYSFSLNLDKFLPRSWEARLPISYSYSKTTMTPLLKSNSDIVLPEDVRKLEEQVSVSQNVSVNMSFNKKGKNPLFSLLLNRMKTRFSYRRSRQKSVNIPYSFGETYDVNVEYSLQFKNPKRVPIFFWTKSIPLLRKLSDSKLSLYPENWNSSARYNRNLTVSDDINNDRRSTIKRDFNGSIRVTYRIFDNLSTTYNYNTRRDLSDLDLVNLSLKSMKDFKLGLETQYGQRFSSSYDPKLLNFLTSQFSFKADYSDNWQQSNHSLRSSLSRDMSVKGEFNHMTLLGGKKSKSQNSTGMRRGRRRAGPADEKKEEEKSENKEDASDGTPFYDPALNILRRLTGWIEPFKYSYGRNYKRTTPGMSIRPSLKYRFGFEEDPDVPLIDDSRAEQASESEAFDIGTGFDLMSGIVTTVKFKQTSSRDIIRRGTLMENTSTNWPDLTIRIQKFKKLPLIKKYVNRIIEIFSPRTGYSRQVKKSRNLDEGFITSKTSSTNYNPLISVNFNLFRTLSISGSYSYSENVQETFNPTNGEPQSESIGTKKSFALTSKYSFRSPHGISIPLLGKLKFNSNVDLTLNVKYNADKTITSNSGGAFRPTADKTDFSFSPVISYTFSQQIRGGITLRWQDTSDNHKNRTNHTRDVQLWTEIRF